MLTQVLSVGEGERKKEKIMQRHRLCMSILLGAEPLLAEDNIHFRSPRQAPSGRPTPVFIGRCPRERATAVQIINNHYPRDAHLKPCWQEMKHSRLLAICLGFSCCSPSTETSTKQWMFENSGYWHFFFYPSSEGTRVWGERCPFS